MTKRFSVFKSKITGLFVVNDNTHEFAFEGVEDASTIMKLVGLLNNYIEENEQLKTTIQQLRTDNTKQKKLLNETMKRNRHTTTTIKNMLENERTELGKMTLRQLWRQIQ